VAAAVATVGTVVVEVAVAEETSGLLGTAAVRSQLCVVTAVVAETSCCVEAAVAADLAVAAVAAVAVAHTSFFVVAAVVAVAVTAFVGSSFFLNAGAKTQLR